MPSSSSLSIHRSGEKALQSAYTSCADAVDEDQVTSRGSHPGDQMHPSHCRCTTITTEVSSDAPSWCRCTGSHGSSREILPMRWMGRRSICGPRKRGPSVHIDPRDFGTCNSDPIRWLQSWRREKVPRCGGKCEAENDAMMMCECILM